MTTPTADELSHADTRRQNILVVKLGAFGNIILSLAAFAAIRQHHAGARISVLTSAAYADWLRTFPYFDDVLVDPRPRWWDFPGIAPVGADAGGRRFQPGVRSADLVAVIALFAAVSGEAPSGVVRDRVRLLAAGP